MTPPPPSMEISTSVKATEAGGPTLPPPPLCVGVGQAKDGEGEGERGSRQTHNSSVASYFHAAYAYAERGSILAKTLAMDGHSMIRRLSTSDIPNTYCIQATGSFKTVSTGHN